MPDFLLKADGFYLLKADGDKLIINASTAATPSHYHSLIGPSNSFARLNGPSNIYTAIEGPDNSFHVLKGEK